MCHQGQALQWLGYDWRSNEHEFGPVEPASLCAICWEQSQCGRRFAYAPSAHESLLGLPPLCTRAAQRILKQVRPWIEPTQSYEKNQLGLSQVFLNSLRLTWAMCLLADAVSIMRARALLERPPSDFPLKASRRSWPGIGREVLNTAPNRIFAESRKNPNKIDVAATNFRNTLF